MPVVPRPARTPPAAPSIAPLVAVALASGAAASVATVALTRALDVPDPVDTGLVATAAPAPAAAPVPEAMPVGAAPADPRIAGLVAALEGADAERSQLAATLVALSREVGELTDAVGAINLPGAAGGAAGADPEAGTDGARRGRGGTDPSADPAEAALAGLVAAGLDPVAAADLQRRQDEYQLARLELVDQAAREGWEDSELFDERLDALDETSPDLREELGEDGYDRYLYESGARNRVRVASIIPGSAASAAGLEPGDVVLGYADGRVFRPGDLQDATRTGTRGEPVTLVAERDGRSVTVQVPRGPLGVTLGRLRREP